MQKKQKEFKDIYEYIRKLQASVAVLVPCAKGIVSYLIDNKITSKQKIELTLDNLLDFVQLGYGEEEFKKLNEYYRTISITNSKIYSDFFEELNKE